MTHWFPLLAIAAALTPQPAFAEPTDHGPSRAEAASDTRTVAFEVEGMSCGRCETSISEALAQVDGVLRVAVSRDERRAQVTYDPGRVGRDRLIEVIRELGFRVQVAADP
jgi:copper chaperone CopZ